MAFSKGVKTEQNDEVGVYVSDIHNGDYIKLQNVCFCNKLPRTFTARVASGLRGGQIEVRVDSLKGKLLCRLEVPATGGWEEWQTLTADFTELVKGRHDLYLVFTGRKGPKLFNFDWWEIRGLEQVNTPLFQTKYTADPSPLVVGDTLFLYTSHDASPEDIPDENEKESAGFFMYDWLLWSTTDMVNWTEHGAVASLKDFPWRSRENGAWAIQTVERNGKYYLYAPLHGHGIGVLESDSPYGPFKDPLGKPLVWECLDGLMVGDITVYLLAGRFAQDFVVAGHKARLIHKGNVPEGEVSDDVMLHRFLHIVPLMDKSRE